MKEKNDKGAAGKKTGGKPEAEVNLMAFTGNNDVVIYSLDKGIRYVVLNTEFKKRLREILKAETKNGEKTTEILRSVDLDPVIETLEALTLIAKRCADNSMKDPRLESSSLITKFKKLVDANYVRLNLPKDYAALLFVTPNYLNQMSQKVLGKTAGEVIRHRKLLEAKRMLIKQELNISQIAHDLNFSDPSHFSKFFKQHTGKSPEEFKRKYL